MAISRAERTEDRRARVTTALGDHRAATGLALFELVELAWHDCYGEPALPDDVVDDVLVVAAGDVDRLVRAAHLAIVDRRDLRVAARSVDGDPP